MYTSHSDQLFVRHLGPREIRKDRQGAGGGGDVVRDLRTRIDLAPSPSSPPSCPQGGSVVAFLHRNTKLAFAFFTIHVPVTNLRSRVPAYLKCKERGTQKHGIAGAWERKTRNVCQSLFIGILRRFINSMQYVYCIYTWRKH